MAHTCHAAGCDTPVLPLNLMCLPHWRRVPAAMKAAVCDAYRPGQEQDKGPSTEWLRAARAAIDHVAVLEGRTQRLLPLLDRLEVLNMTLIDVAWLRAHQPNANPMVNAYGPGPKGKRCGDCVFIRRFRYTRTYFKCAKRGITHGAATDHRLSWDACAKFTAPPEPVLEGVQLSQAEEPS